MYVRYILSNILFQVNSLINIYLTLLLMVSKNVLNLYSLYFVKNPYNPYMISCTDFRKSVHKIRTSVHKIRTSGFKSVHMLFKFHLFFTCHLKSNEFRTLHFQSRYRVEKNSDMIFDDDEFCLNTRYALI